VEAIFFVAIIHWFGNLWKATLFRKGFDVRLILLFGVVGLATSFFGARISLGANASLFLRLLGSFLATYSLFLMFQSTFKVPARNMAAISGGALSGFFAGIFGMGGAIRSMFLSAFDLPKAVYIATAGAIGLFVDSTRIVTYMTSGATLPKRLWWGLFLFIPVSFLGATIAKKIVGKIPQQQFRLVIVAFLFILGIKFILWP